jgi:DNA modification methylase
VDDQRELVVVDVAVGALLPHERNPRTITRQRLDALKVDLEADPEMLRARPLIALPDGRVVAGNQRLRAVQELAWKTVPVVFADLDEVRAREWALRDNNLYGDWDEEMLAEYLQEMVDAGAELVRTGFTDRELERFLQRAAARPVVERVVPPLPEQAESRLGEVYELGPHRLMCGDATNSEHVALLLGGETPALCVTDPPYGVEYDPEWRDRAAVEGRISYAARRVGQVLNDDRADWGEAFALFPGDVVYCWHASLREEVRLALEGCGFELRSQIVWAKPVFAISRGHYHWQHEACWYAVRRGGKAGWIGNRSQSTLWEVPLDANVPGGHSTQKPVELMARAIRNHSGDVYEPFAGTGSTLIAADALGRRCLAMELHPGWCDVIRDRYENWLGGDRAPPAPPEERWMPLARLGGEDSSLLPPDAATVIQELVLRVREESDDPAMPLWRVLELAAADHLAGPGG